MENQEVEYKQNWQDEYLATISAFANSKGGKLIIGMDDEGNPIGVGNPEKLLEILPNKIRDKLGILCEINLIEMKDKQVIEIKVSPSTFPISYNGKFYIRSGSTTQLLEGQGLINFLLQKTGQTWNGLIEEKATLDDIDISTIEKFISLAKDKIPSISLEKDWKVILEKLNLIREGKITNACILLFSKNPQKFYIQAKIKVGRFKSLTEIISTDVIEGNLFEQLEKSLNILMTKYLISKTTFEGIYRKEMLEYPYEALREAIINALIHRDYLSTSDIQIRVYDDRLVIMNPGSLPPEITIEMLKSEHPSKPRNPLLANIFFYAGFIETWGRGTIKIIEACKNYGLPEPEFENNGFMKVVFYKDIYTEENLRKMGLNERQIKAVMYVKERGKITNSEYQKINNCHRNTASYDLLQLVEKGILKYNRKKGAGAYYEIAH
ncbi:ATP-binding protein [Hydrogenobacter thermophilus]|uniref:ATP-binding protein n=1 Tax=Hydrogenobacter thermophilus TaxID=940 RepID=UPI0030F97DE6